MSYDILKSWQKESEQELAELTHPILGLIRVPEVELYQRILALIELVKKKDEQLILASNYAYYSGARDLAISTSNAIALTEQLK